MASSFPTSTESNPFGSGSDAALPPTPSIDASSAAAPARSDVFDRVVDGAHQTIDRLAESAAPHVQRLQQGVTAASAALQQSAGQVRDTGTDWTESLRCSVREHPLAAVAAALAVGLLIAKLSQR